MSTGTNAADEDDPRRELNLVECDACDARFLTVLQLQGHRGSCPRRTDS